MSKPRKIAELEAIAREMVGDRAEHDNRPNLFFVTNQGVVDTISRDFEAAYARFIVLLNRQPETECALEDRRTGCIASLEPVEDGSTKLDYIDDTRTFNYR